jgi:lipid II:glycine glycyltransferase (peptidoglycan interpeptide bridge formation enzyme)
MEIADSKNIDPSIWNNVILRNVDIHNVFQRYEWALLMKESYGYKPLFATIRDGENLLGGLLYFKKPVIKFLSSYETCGGPSYVNANHFLSIKSEIIKHLACLPGYPFYISIRPRVDDKDEVFYNKYNFMKSIFYTIIIDVAQNEETIWSSFSKNTRYNVRKAEKNNVEVKEAKNWSQWFDFYKLHVAHCLDRRIAPKNLEFFKYLYDVFLSKDLCRLLIAYKDNLLIGGSLFFCSNGVMTDYIGAIDDRYRKFAINDLFMWETIKYGTKNEYFLFDLGDTWPNPQSHLYSIHQFKNKWGGQLIESSFFIKGRTYRFGRNLVLNNKLIGNMYELFHEKNLI